MTAPVAFLFPGQGSQSVGMGRDLCARFPLAQSTFDRANQALGFDLARLCFEGPQDVLTLTENAQPALLTVSYATAVVLSDELGLHPSWVAGHSLGEFSALVTAGALGFEDGVRVVRERGLAMQRAVAPGDGTMAAIFGLDLATIEKLCAEAAQGEVVSPANLNGAGQIVIAGHTGAVARAVDRARELGAKRAVPLNVSAPFHCELMRPAAEHLRTVLAGVGIAAPGCPLIANVDAQAHSDADGIAARLVEQVCKPVLWEDSVRELHRLGCTQAVEVGPGRVLTGLLKRIAGEIRCLPSDDLDALPKALAS